MFYMLNGYNLHADAVDIIGPTVDAAEGQIGVQGHCGDPEGVSARIRDDCRSDRSRVAGPRHLVTIDQIDRKTVLYLPICSSAAIASSSTARLNSIPARRFTEGSSNSSLSPVCTAEHADGVNWRRPVINAFR
jgi:hypothetical protein